MARGGASARQALHFATMRLRFPSACRPRANQPDYSFVDLGMIFAAESATKNDQRAEAEGPMKTPARIVSVDIAQSVERQIMERTGGGFVTCVLKRRQTG
jgi:hypothetical protein